MQCILAATGVRIIGPVGIGEVQMTTFFYRTKSLLKMSFRIEKKLDGDLTEDKEKFLGPPLSSKFRGKSMKF